MNITVVQLKKKIMPMTIYFPELLTAESQIILQLILRMNLHKHT